MTDEDAADAAAPGTAIDVRSSEVRGEYLGVEYTQMI